MNVVPAGFNWKKDAADKAQKAGKFLFVGGKEDVTKRTLSGFKRYWDSADPNDQRIIYNTTYRITGTPENVAQAMRWAGYTEADIAAALADSITRDNYMTTKYEAAKAEIAYAKQVAEKKPAKVSPFTLKHIVWFAQNLGQAKILTKTNGGANAPAAGGKKKGARKSLADKVRDLAAGRTLDVSAIDPATGDGAVNKPFSAKPRTGKYGTDRVPFISNNIANYRRAIEIVYGPAGLQTYATDIEYVTRAINTNGQAAAPVAPAVPVPVAPAPVVPGATLAPVPTIQGFPVM